MQEYEGSDYNRPFEYSCGGNFKVLNLIESRHSNVGEDRQYRFTCRDVNKWGKFSSCFWTDYLEDYDKPFIYTCPKNQVMTGVASKYNNTHFDRVFKFQCCLKGNFKTKSCQSTRYLNELEESFSFGVGENRVFIGFHSYHDDTTEWVCAKSLNAAACTHALYIR